MLSMVNSDPHSLIVVENMNPPPRPLGSLPFNPYIITWTNEKYEAVRDLYPRGTSLSSYLLEEIVSFSELILDFLTLLDYERDIPAATEPLKERTYAVIDLHANPVVSVKIERAIRANLEINDHLRRHVSLRRNRIQEQLERYEGMKRSANRDHAIADIKAKLDETGRWMNVLDMERQMSRRALNRLAVAARLLADDRHARAMGLAPEAIRIVKRPHAERHKAIRDEISGLATRVRREIGDLSDFYLRHRFELWDVDIPGEAVVLHY